MGELLVSIGWYWRVGQCLWVETQDLLEIWCASREVDSEDRNSRIVSKTDWWLVLWFVPIGREKYYIHGEDWKYTWNQHKSEKIDQFKISHQNQLINEASSKYLRKYRRKSIFIINAVHF